MRTGAIGLVLTAAVTAILWWIWGGEALLPGAAFGLLATAIQVIAVQLMRPASDRPFAKFAARWGMGMGLRLLGVAVFVAAVLSRRDLFPPLPAAFAYLGVLVPLLYTEIRFLR